MNDAAKFAFIATENERKKVDRTACATAISPFPESQSENLFSFQYGQAFGSDAPGTVKKKKWWQNIALQVQNSSHSRHRGKTLCFFSLRSNETKHERHQRKIRNALR